MAATQQNAINTQIWQGIGAIADNESLMKRLSKYVAKLVKENAEDPTRMTKDEFFARVEEANKGPLYELKKDETIEDLINRIEA